MTTISKKIELRGIKDITLLENKPKVITDIFKDMKEGKELKEDGKAFGSGFVDLSKTFVSFWHWYILYQKDVNNKEIKDITTTINTTYDENNFVYFEKEDLEKVLPFFTSNEQVMLRFMFDTVIRAPTELANIRLSDISDVHDQMKVTIREETSKTYGRTIKILECKDTLKEYLKHKKLKDDDYVFQFSPPMMNDKLKKVFIQVFGDKMTKGGRKYSEISMYDFRHSGACYWRKGAYKSKIDALMYRGGWSNLDMLNYYTKKIGMEDTIEEGDLLTEADKSEVLKLKAQLQNLTAYILKDASKKEREELTRTIGTIAN